GDRHDARVLIRQVDLLFVFNLATRWLRWPTGRLLACLLLSLRTCRELRVVLGLLTLLRARLDLLLRLGNRRQPRFAPRKFLRYRHPSGRSAASACSASFSKCWTSRFSCFSSFFACP